MEKFYLILLLLIFYFSSSKAQTLYSGPAGNWCSQPDGKGQCINEPKEQDDLIVDRTISIKGPFNPKGKIKIIDGGRLTIENTQSGDMEVFGELEIEKGGILILQKNFSLKNNSEVTIENNANVLVSGNFKNENNSTDVEINGKMEVAGDFENGKNAEIKGNGQIAVAGSCNNTGKIFGVNNTCAGIKNLTLPVELLFFEAKVVGNAVQLNWATSTEQNFDHFEVERSINAREFSSVGEPIKGAGNPTISSYNFIDEAPFTGRSYYRLKAVDFDGSVEYHPAVTVNFTGYTDIKIFPNPSRGNNINITTASKPKSNNTLKIYNIIGEEVFSARFSSGTNEFNFEKPLGKGLYIVIVEDGNTKTQMKLTVQ